MKKLLLLVLGAAGAVMAIKKQKASQAETTRWADATDSVKRS